MSSIVSSGITSSKEVHDERLYSFFLASSVTCAIRAYVTVIFVFGYDRTIFRPA